jgi:hypothetical protein
MTELCILGEIKRERQWGGHARSLQFKADPKRKLGLDHNLTNILLRQREVRIIEDIPVDLKGDPVVRAVATQGRDNVTNLASCAPRANGKVEENFRANTEKLDEPARVHHDH